LRRLLQDDNGFLYNSDNAGYVYARDPASTSLSLLAVSTSLGGTIEAMAFKLQGGVRYLYVCVTTGLLRRLQINYSFNRPASFIEVNSIVIQQGVCRGVSVEDDGTIYYSGGTNLVAKVRSKQPVMQGGMRKRGEAWQKGGDGGGEYGAAVLLCCSVPCAKAYLQQQALDFTTCCQLLNSQAWCRWQ